MSLSTFIGSSLDLQRADKAVAQRGLLLMGGGARTAYQAGVLKAVGEILGAQSSIQTSTQLKKWPFPIVVGTSAGALNGAYLASRTQLGLGAFAELAGFWQSLRSAGLYNLNVPVWMRSSRWLTALGLSRRAANLGAVLDNMLLIDSLHKAVNLSAIEANLLSGQKGGDFQALAVTASSYSSGLHWTFCQRSPGAAPLDTSPRAGRRLVEEPITIDHLAASSAIPGIFPAASLFVGGQREFFGDGSMRHSSPLSAPLKLGATHVLAIGVGQPDRAGFAGQQVPSRPTLGMVAGHAMASVFHDTLRADVEQALRVNDSLTKMPPELAKAAGYRPVQVLQISPSQSLDAIAVEHFDALPQGIRHVLAGFGARGASGAALASYLLFESGFINALMQIGERDAFVRKAELLAFFEV